MRRPLADRIKAKAARIAREQLQLSQLAKRQKKADRELDTRRKIIVGAIVMGEMERNPQLNLQIRNLLNSAVTRPHDRAALAHLLPAGSHPPAVNTDLPPENPPAPDVRTALPATSAKIDQPGPPSTEDVIAQLDALIGQDEMRDPPEGTRGAEESDRRAG